MAHYSLRDFRSIFHVSEIERDFGGSFDHHTRRWSFPSPDSRQACAQFLRRQENIVPLHLPGLHRWRDQIRKSPEFAFLDGNAFFASGVGRGDTRLKRSPDVLILRNEETREEALPHLLGILGASRELVKASATTLQQLNAEVFFDLNDEVKHRVEHGVLFHSEAAGIVARNEAVTRLRPPSQAALDASRREIQEHIPYVLSDVLNLDASFTEVPHGALVRGILVGRSTHHLAILTDDTGQGTIVERAPIAFPLRLDEKAEVSPNRGASIRILFNDRGAGRALQDVARVNTGTEKADDIELGPMYLDALEASGPCKPLLALETNAGEDVDGTVVSIGSHTAAILDPGATVTFLPHHHVPSLVLGARATSGPSFQRITRPLTFTRTR
ncbi:MAG: hypothetical protein ACYDHD_03505 [Vulcanimicrobiaceae bacterium]